MTNDRIEGYELTPKLILPGLSPSTFEKVNRFEALTNKEISACVKS